MSTILVGECKQEVSTFNPVSSSYEDFDVDFGDEFFDYQRGLATEVAGALSVFDATDDVEPVPTYSARAFTSGGTLDRPSFQRIAGEFLDSFRAAPPADAIYLSLHGAMAADGEDDPEGNLLAELRKILGEEIPIVISLDLHGILTERMVRHSDAIVAFHTYPHVDFYRTGERAARLLLRILAGEARPVTAYVPIPALVRGDELITATGLFGVTVRVAQDIEERTGGLAAGMFIGNPFTDVPDLRSNSFVVADGNPALAQREALHLARDFWRVHERLQAPLTSVDEALIVARESSGAVILVDAADATSSGASGDSNVLLRGLLEGGYAKKALLPIVDPGAVVDAMAAGIGATVHTSLGGKLDSGRFTPLPVEAHVHMLSEGRIVSESNGAVWTAGDTAVLQVGSITVIATSRPVSLYDRSLFFAHGQDPTRFDAVVVKSPHCQPHFFDEWAECTINVDAPGSTSANLPTLGHTKCRRPIFPLDPGVTFEPQVITHQRPRYQA